MAPVRISPKTGLGRDLLPHAGAGRLRRVFHRRRRELHPQKGRPCHCASTPTAGDFGRAGVARIQKRRLAAGFDPVSVGRQCLPGCDSGLQMIRSREICHHPIRLTIDVFKRVLVAVRATYLRTGFLLDVFKVRKDRVIYELFQICDLKMTSTSLCR